MTEYIRAKSDKKTKEERETGKFYTTNNPFNHKEFIKWYNKAIKDTDIILEPFAGGNNIPKLIQQTDLKQIKWQGYDINPNNKDIIKQDTIKDFPTGYKTVITNPPYLSKSAATQKGLNYPDIKFNNIYKHCLNDMLNNADYIAVIIPDPFITDKQFKERCETIISLNIPMFDDTNQPACLALFTPNKTDDFKVYINDMYVGKYNEVKNNLPKAEKQEWSFTKPTGQIFMKSYDGKRDDERMYFAPNKNQHKQSRHYFIVNTPLDIKDIKMFTDICNNVLSDIREETKDIFLVARWGLREDGLYQRQITKELSRVVLNKAYEIYKENEYE
mgnify:CR=1 FL=1